MNLGRLPVSSNKLSNNGYTPRDELGDSLRVIEACREDIVALWENAVVQKLLKTRKIQLQDQSGL